MTNRKKYIKRIFEQMLMDAPKTAPTTKPAPVKTPSTPSKPSRPGPIRRDRPSVKPKPMATAEDVVNRFLEEIKTADINIKFDVKVLSKRYGLSESKIIKSFSQFINEASLEGNPGVPGQPDDNSYLDRIKQRAAVTSGETEERYGAEIGEIHQISGQIKQMQSGKERDLEKLAEDAIRDIYGSILDGVELDIKIPDDQEDMKDQMEEVDLDPPEETEVEELEDEDTIREIHKRKIGNAITQGEAKNSKLILNMDFIKDGVMEIFGEEAGEEYIEYLNKITAIASFYDWDIPLETQRRMWGSHQMPPGGTVEVDWDGEEPEQEDPDLAQRVLDGINVEDEEDVDIPEDANEMMEDFTPTIHARGIDLAMLIHETIKGIYQLITSVGIPDDEETAGIVIANTDTLSGEIEDLKYGPYMAEDLNRFVMSFSESEDIENLKEHFFGKLMAMPAQEFLELFALILMEDPKAKQESQYIIDDIKQELREFDIENIEGAFDEDPEEYEEETADNSFTSQEDSEEKEDMTDREIQSLIDDALDAGDMDEVKRLAALLKESLQLNIDTNRFGSIGSFSMFKKRGSEPVYEDLKAAKQYFVKNRLEKLIPKDTKGNLDLTKLPEPEKEIDKETGLEISAEVEKNPKKRLQEISDKIANSREFKTIQQVVMSNNMPGHAVTFTKFVLDQNASVGDLKTVIDSLNDQQVKALLGELPMRIEDYGNIPLEKGQVPGWEKLVDDITKLKETAGGRWIIKALQTKAGLRDYMGTPIAGATGFNQREAFKEAPKEVQDSIIALASRLNVLDETGATIKKFKKNLGNKKSLEIIKTELQNKIEGMGSTMSDVIEKIESNFPGSSVVWEGEKSFLAIFRSPNALGEMCKITSWCIRPRGTGAGQGGSGMFYTYNSGGNIQYVYFNYDLPTTDDNHIIGFTVTSKGKITEANDVGSGSAWHLTGKTLDSALDYCGIDEDNKKELINALPKESELARDVEPYYKKLQDKNIADVITDIIKDNEKTANINTFNKKETKSTYVLDQLVVTEMSLSPDADKARKALLSRFKEKGCTNLVSAKHFKTLFERSEEFTDDLLDKVISGSRERQESFKKMITYLKHASAKEKEAALQYKSYSMKEILANSETMISNIDETIAYLTALKTVN